MWDYWSIIDHFDRYRRLDLRVLWEQHNEHRIVFPELCFAIDALLLHAHQVLPLVSSYLFYLATFGLICWAVFAERKAGYAACVAACAAGGIIMGWPGSALVIGIPFLLQWTMLAFFAVASLASLAAYQRGRSRGFLILSVACAVVANYSSANGLLFWIVLLAAAVVLKLSKRDLVLLAVTAAASIGLYFVGYHRNGSPLGFELFKAPLYACGFALAYLSSPFGAMHPGTDKMTVQGIEFGSVSLLLYAAIVWGFRRARLLRTPAAVVLIGFSSFAILSAIATAAGRMNVHDPRFGAATATRYVTLPLTNWAVLLCGIIWLASRSRWPRTLPLVLALLAVLIPEHFFSRLERSDWARGTVDTFADQQWASLSVENGLVTPEVKRILFGDPASVDRLLRILRGNHLSIFDRADNRMLGKRMESLPVDKPIAGQIAYTVPVEGGWELAGWDLADRPDPAGAPGPGRRNEARRGNRPEIDSRPSAPFGIAILAHSARLGWICKCPLRKQRRPAVSLGQARSDLDPGRPVLRNGPRSSVLRPRLRRLLLKCNGTLRQATGSRTLRR